MASPLSIIVDDKRTDLVVLGGPSLWTATSEPEWFNGTSQSPTFALNNSGLFGTLQIKFQGTSIAFFGITPPVFTDSQILTVSIDGSTPYNTTYSDPNPQTYRQWYQSPLLADGTHNVALSHIAGTSFDYAVVTVGDSTPLASEHVIVDNDDPAMVFDGRWRRSQDLFNSGPQPDGFPYHNTTHQTTYIGSSFTYRFSGRSAAIYGIFTWSNIGLLSLSFTLDGETLSQNYRVNTDTPQFVSELGQQQNFLFYSYDFLQAGDHTLVVNVTDCVNQTFTFDYITYNPSFSSLQDMPKLANASSASGLTAGKSSKANIWAIVAGISGTLLLLLLLGLVFLYLRRRSSKGRYTAINPFVPRLQSEVTIIPLSNQQSPPPTASTYDDTMALMQSVNTPQHGFSALSTMQDTRSTLADPPSTGQLHTPATAQNTVSSTPATGSTDIPDMYRASRDRNSDLDSMYTAEPSPPSYDETTRGQPPPTITYIIQR
ncbi:hypothetical protein GALMADRAFT_245443 [Galerina marginata CBS 339.88]|uniref:Uncharacterized protein n=1 Tax=Galerina marginata (strain CBS 339.88) TaxID=685588 RepID=A0A067TEK4_GALM3|nr:hypothetical protein GALMADRAFT_245443 [Galerina marginata CBS 339.88]